MTLKKRVERLEQQQGNTDQWSLTVIFLNPMLGESDESAKARALAEKGLTDADAANVLFVQWVKRDARNES